MKETYLEVTQETGAAFFSRQIEGEIVMLNLLRFRETADYSDNPELEPGQPTTGAEAFQKYIDETLPFLKESGGDILFLGKGGKYLIGPQNEEWDFVMLIKQKSKASFLEFSSNKEYMKVLGHRTAALEDSRLLPIVESNNTV